MGGRSTKVWDGGVGHEEAASSAASASASPKARSLHDASDNLGGPPPAGSDPDTRNPNVTPVDDDPPARPWRPPSLLSGVRMDMDTILRQPRDGWQGKNTLRRHSKSSPRCLRSERNIVPVSCASFLPDIVRERFAAEGAAELAQPEATEEFDAGVLFLDISGYTKLTKWLTENVENGAEEMSAALNTYFSAVLDVVRTRGGDVYKFAGDALLCLFRGPDAVFNMVDTAVHAVHQLRNFSVLDGSTTLSLHGAADYGPVRGMHLGGISLNGVRRWEWNLHAPTMLARIGDMLTTAKEGQVGVSQRCWQPYQDARPDVLAIVATGSDASAIDQLSDGSFRLNVHEDFFNALPPPRTTCSAQSQQQPVQQQQGSGGVVSASAVEDN